MRVAFLTNWGRLVANLLTQQSRLVVVFFQPVITSVLTFCAAIDGVYGNFDSNVNNCVA